MQRSLLASIPLIILLGCVGSSPLLAQEVVEKTIKIETTVLDIRPDLASEIESIARDKRKLQASLQEGKARMVAFIETAARRTRGADFHLTQRIPVPVVSRDQSEQRFTMEDTGVHLSARLGLVTAETADISLTLDINGMALSTGGQRFKVNRRLASDVRVRIGQPMVLIGAVQGDALAPPSTSQTSSASGNFVVFITARFVD